MVRVRAGGMREGGVGGKRCRPEEARVCPLPKLLQNKGNPLILTPSIQDLWEGKT